jgi:adenylate kinase family enzyme
MNDSKEINRIKRIMDHNKFYMDESWFLAYKNIVLDIVIDSDFNKELFWKRLKDRSLPDKDIPLIENVLKMYNIVLEVKK